MKSCYRRSRSVHDRGKRIARFGFQPVDTFRRGCCWVAMEHEGRQRTTIDNWPEMVGKNGDLARGIILSEHPNLDVIVLPVGSIVTEDYRLDRVRIYIDDDGNVVGIPKRG